MQTETRIFLILCGLNVIILQVLSEPIIATLFQEWIKNFETIEKLASFSKSLKNDTLSLNCEAPGEGYKIFHLSDFDDFDFSGLLDKSGTFLFIIIFLSIMILMFCA